jgi:glycine/D-amino acid oxidase-like deaminating enzyme
MRYQAAMAAAPPQLALSPWIDPPADPRPPLAGDARADVAVVGAGFTGLSAALALRRAGADVVVLEREFAGFGASGRNAGHLTPTIGKDLPTLLLLFGEARTARLVAFAEAAVERVEAAIREHDIDCAYQARGNVMAAVHPKQEARLLRAAAVAARVGAKVEFLDRAEMRRRALPEAFLAGAFETRGGTLDPGRYVGGLRRAALAAGARLHEGCAVTEIVDDGKPRLRTAHGSIVADAVVLATNAYAVELGGLKARIFPLHDTLFETAPLSPSQRAALGWPGGEGIYTAHESLESFRLTERGTIVGGSKGVRYAFGSALSGESSAWTIAENVRAFRERFPMLRDVPIAHTWGGWIAMTFNMLPALGRTGKHGNLHYALGYNGHGIAAATALGAAVADSALGRPNAAAEELAPFALPLPPEPLRWLLVRGLLGALNWLDRRIDADVRRGAGTTA